MSVAKFVWKYLKKVKFFFFISFALYLLSFSTSRINVYISAQLIEMISKFDGDNIIKIEWILMLSAFVVTSLTGSIFLYAAHIIDACYMPKLRSFFEKDMFEHVYKHSLQFFDEEKSGNIGKMKDAIFEGLTDLQSTCTGFLMNFVTIFLSIGIIAFMHIWLALFFLFITVLFGLLTSRTRKKIISNSKEVTEIESEVNGIYYDGLNNLMSVKSFANVGYEKLYLFYKLKSFLRKDKAEKIYRAKSIYKCNFLYDLMALCFYVATFACWRISGLSLGDMVFIITSIGTLITSTKSFSYTVSGLFRTYGRLQSSINFLFRPYDIVDSPSAKKLKVKNAEVCFNNVNFAYKNKALLFTDFNLTVKKGEKIGIIGKSGSGKSTLVKLLSRYYDIQSGNITINGQDISLVTQDSLRKNIAFIPQDTLLFNRSIMDNIRYGNTKATDKEIITAAKEAYCHEFIEKLPQKYQTIVGNKGVLLSGGERQRIAIARAILSKAPILVLDEATSALDSESELYIQKSLEKLMNKKTVIAIAHRLSTLKSMDKIIVLEKGRIVEEGSHESLLKQKGTFYKFHKMQSKGFVKFK